ncbi:histidine phosphatase family protein [Algicella marina]|uniref:Alpha-ribazole phosphatase n=1 Tax=Algicella marina TaxID=2683284 RepID=A0A6P1SU66_9RHOB|nr:histidine phosphatase family protein [Algicella marina]QHQ33968.1 alpha-ribazole phosphatase [Algicella marina]
MVLILMRHTRPENGEGRCYGRTDLPLPPDAAAQMDAALATLTHPPQALATSPARRCRLLADRAARRFGLIPQVLPDLREMNFGTWENRRWSEVPRAELDQWAADFLHARPHGGESVAQMQARVLPALAALQGAGTTLVVTHAGVAKIAAAAMGHTDPWTHSLPYGETLTIPATLSLAPADA